MKAKSKQEAPKVFTIADYPKSAGNGNKEIAVEDFEFLYGHSYLRRIYADDSADLTRFDDTAKMWVVLQFPAKVEPDAESRIRTVIRHNFDVSKCVKPKKSDLQAKAA